MPLISEALAHRISHQPPAVYQPNHTSHLANFSEEPNLLCDYDNDDLLLAHSGGVRGGAGRPGCGAGIHTDGRHLLQAQDHVPRTHKVPRRKPLRGHQHTRWCRVHGWMSDGNRPDVEVRVGRQRVLPHEDEIPGRLQVFRGQPLRAVQHPRRSGVHGQLPERQRTAVEDQAARKLEILHADDDVPGTVRRVPGRKQILPVVDAGRRRIHVRLVLVVACIPLFVLYRNGSSRSGRRAECNVRSDVCIFFNHTKRHQDMSISFDSILQALPNFSTSIRPLGELRHGYLTKPDFRDCAQPTHARVPIKVTSA
eukprot:IDg1445t1